MEIDIEIQSKNVFDCAINDVTYILFFKICFKSVTSFMDGPCIRYLFVIVGHVQDVEDQHFILKLLH